jgi:hypothetical protein
MKRQVPIEREMTDMIATAFERLPAPDPRRLAAIEQQLLEQPRLRGRTKYVWWWLVGALVAGAASALWWAVDYDSGEGRKAAAVEEIPAPPPATVYPSQPDRSLNQEATSEAKSTPKDSTLIYRRQK